MTDFVIDWVFLDFNQQKKNLAEKLRLAREEKMRKLEEKQKRERDEFLRDSDTGSPKDVTEV